MKHTALFLVVVMVATMLINQNTIQTQKDTINKLERALAIYHEKLTGEPHPLYSPERSARKGE